MRSRRAAVLQLSGAQVRAHSAESERTMFSLSDGRTDDACTLRAESVQQKDLLTLLIRAQNKQCAIASAMVAKPDKARSSGIRDWLRR